jgi:hypothetical protein
MNLLHVEMPSHETTNKRHSRCFGTKLSVEIGCFSKFEVINSVNA